MSPTAKAMQVAIVAHLKRRGFDEAARVADEVDPDAISRRVRAGIAPACVHCGSVERDTHSCLCPECGASW